jgi:hypothetical protein
MRPTQTTLSQGEKLVIYRKKNPISHLSRIKNPILLYLSVAAALWAYSYVLSSLDDLNSLGITASFLSLSKAEVYYVPARLCQSITVYL